MLSTHLISQGKKLEITLEETNGITQAHSLSNAIGIIANKKITFWESSQYYDIKYVYGNMRTSQLLFLR